MTTKQMIRALAGLAGLAALAAAGLVAFMMLTMTAFGQVERNKAAAAAFDNNTRKLDRLMDSATAAGIPALADSSASGFAFQQAPGVCYVGADPTGDSRSAKTVWCEITRNLGPGQVFFRVGASDGQTMALSGYGFNQLLGYALHRVWNGSFDEWPGYAAIFEMFIVQNGATTRASVTLNISNGRVIGGPFADLGIGSNISQDCSAASGQCLIIAAIGGSGQPVSSMPVSTQYESMVGFMPLPTGATVARGLSFSSEVGLLRGFEAGEYMWVACAYGVCGQRTVFLSLPPNPPTVPGKG